ncbi:TetR family transcriptional regulator [Mobilisporobacter senegalensis]|uniref:TetR family transcriptional regulator n=1 Tax=Mobilisporobacter senegalensis TaxID=1329262 RepID=A0A3N1XYS5_9FIRM|nr:TetR/AcrR family transcriptional regulator [Mobilisporobacter senegalensis]ROR31438.1 TetR family transcriptional regulator [Mobilisporobacter senegalensis]
MDKKELILNAMENLLREGKAGTASVSDIAKKAGIAKGGMYYYFHSKEEVLDALVERQYGSIIESCRILIEQSSLDAISKFALLLKSYTASFIDASLDEYLHKQQNAAIHQKSLSKILTALTPVVSGIIEDGIQEGSFTCGYPQEYAEIIMSVFTFLLDPGIFGWQPEQIIRKLQALASLLEKGLSVAEGSFAFLWKVQTD